MLFYVVLMCMITILVVVSNVSCLLLLVYIALDPYNALQGIDYCIFSLIIADLIDALFISPFSIASKLANNTWLFGEQLCQACGYLSYTLFTINANSLFLVSVDRYLFITDTKYASYKKKTRVRCICKLVLAWIISAAFCIPPLMIDESGIYNDGPSRCRISWKTLEAYYMAVTFILILPTLCGTIYFFVRIFIWRIKCRHGYYSMKAATMENLLRPTHRMALALVLMFWISWSPYIFRLLMEYHFVFMSSVQHFWDIWSGVSQSMWKLPIMIGLCPRYREYFIAMLRIDCCSNRRQQKPDADCDKYDIEMHI